MSCPESITIRGRTLTCQDTAGKPHNFHLYGGDTSTLNDTVDGQPFLLTWPTALRRPAVKKETPK